MMALSAMGGSKLDDLSQFVPMMSMWKSTLAEGATSMFDAAISKMKSAYHSYSSPATTKRWRSIFSDLTSRYLGWNNGGDSYDGSRSQYVQDALDAKTAYFWFITAFSNSFAVGFGLKAALQGVHPKFHFSATMARSMAFHIVIGSIEFVWVVIMYLSVPQWWHSVVLVVLDSIQNVTIWIQMANSQGVKLVTNSCYLFCLVVKAAMCCGLVLIDPFSRDYVPFGAAVVAQRGAGGAGQHSKCDDLDSDGQLSGSQIGDEQLLSVLFGREGGDVLRARAH